MAGGSKPLRADTAESMRLVAAVRDLRTHRERLLGTAARILDEMERLALYAESETVRLGACRDLLDRVGLRADVVVDEAEDVPEGEALEALVERFRAEKAENNGGE